MVAGHIVGMGVEGIVRYYCGKIISYDTICSTIALTAHESVEPIVDSVLYPLTTQFIINRFSTSNIEQVTKPSFELDIYELGIAVLMSAVSNSIVKKFVNEEIVDYILPFSGMIASFAGSYAYKHNQVTPLFLMSAAAYTVSSFKDEISGFAEELY